MEEIAIILPCVIRGQSCVEYTVMQYDNFFLCGAHQRRNPSELREAALPPCVDANLCGPERMHMGMQTPPRATARPGVLSHRDSE
jgi:hypothetical protein